MRCESSLSRFQVRKETTVTTRGPAWSLRPASEPLLRSLLRRSVPAWPPTVPDATRTRVRPCPPVAGREVCEQVTTGPTDNAGMPTPIRCAICLRVVQAGEAVRPCRSREARYRARRRLHASCLRAAVLAPRGGR